ncbi:MAG TPA: serine/threonine-protein kinase [Vicinamibacteria bacterium]
MADAAPRRLGRYLIQDQIGRGMMGVVYRALDPDLGRTVALKAVRLAFEVAEGERAVFEKRFVAEAQAAARLSHPGIVVVHDVGRDPETGTPYIALEHLEGRTLADLAASGAPMDWRRALDMTAKLADALHHAHAQGIVHRDVKPANVMVLPSGQPKLMDFGIAKLPASQLTSTGQFFGTPAYMAPEQFGDGEVDGRSDLFSLGVVLYRLLAGADPFGAPSVAAILARISRHDPPPPSSLVAGIPPAVDAIVARALAKSPADRFQDGASFARAIEQVLADPAAMPVVAPAVAAPPTVRSARPRRPFGPPAIIAAAVALVALAAAFAIPRSGLPVARGLLAPAPARLAVVFEHPLRSGVLKVWIDDEVVLEEPLESRVVDDLVVFRTRKGQAELDLEVPPGEHYVRLQVEAEGFHGSRRIRGTFQSGQPRRLRARVSGLIGKELSLWWEE